MESRLEDIAQISGEIDYGDVRNIMGRANKDAAFRKKVRALVGDWEDAAEADDETEMTRIAKELKTLVPAESKTEAENTHLVDLGLDAKFKDMIDAVFYQMRYGYWKNSPRMRGYWEFATPILKGNKVYLEIDNAHLKNDGAGTVYNLWDGMPDARVKQFLADKIKFLVKEEGLKWDRGNTYTTDYLSYSDPYSVNDCYYAYELLKGRNVSKHPEYSEAYIGIKDGKEFPVNVEYIEVDDDWQGNTNPDIYKVSVNGESGETDATETEKVCVGKVLRELGYSLKESKKAEAFDQDAIDRFTVDDPNYIDHVVIDPDDSDVQAIVKITKVPGVGKFKVIALHSGFANPVTLMSGTFFGAAHEYEELADMDPEEALAVIKNA